MKRLCLLLAPLALACASSPAPTAAAPPTAEAPAAPAVAAPAQSADPMVGQAAPDFALTAQDGTAVHLAALAGKPVVLYFYPQDETPGCTKEACSFRDAWDALAAKGVVLVGVSADSLDSHRAFAAHYKLPFLLVSDGDGALAKKYGVPFEGAHKRQTIVVGADGRVKNVYRKVDVKVHAQEILAEVR